MRWYKVISLTPNIPKMTLCPPPGRPNWKGKDDLALIYLGWGHRDFKRDPVAMHYDLGTNYYLLLRGEMTVTTGTTKQIVRGPKVLLFDPNCAFSLVQSKQDNAEILVWIWKGLPNVKELRPPPGGVLCLDLPQRSLDSLIGLHVLCQNEVAVADELVPHTLLALRELIETEILRANRGSHAMDDVRWILASTWMKANLSIHAPVPALCDFLRMSPSTLHRFFQAKVGLPPGTYFRRLKASEARRLIHEEGWQVKAAAYHLGYRHANDLSRALNV